MVEQMGCGGGVSTGSTVVLVPPVCSYTVLTGEEAHSIVIIIKNKHQLVHITAPLTPPSITCCHWPSIKTQEMTDLIHSQYFIQCLTLTGGNMSLFSLLLLEVFQFKRNVVKTFNIKHTWTLAVRVGGDRWAQLVHRRRDADSRCV